MVWFELHVLTSLLWFAQNVEETECRRAYDLAVETYTTSFDKSTPPEEV
jgi:hypothetical protein